MITMSMGLADAVEPIVFKTIHNARENVLQDLIDEIQEVADKFVSDYREKLKAQIEIDVRDTLVKVFKEGENMNVNIVIDFKDFSKEAAL